MLFDITNYQTWIPIVAGTIIPFVVAFLAKQNASDNVKSVLAFLGAALTALGVYLADVGQSHTWKGAASAFFLALVMAVTTRKALTEQFVTKVLVGTPGIIGPKQPPLR